MATVIGIKDYASDWCEANAPEFDSEWRCILIREACDTAELANHDKEAIDKSLARMARKLRAAPGVMDLAPKKTPFIRYDPAVVQFNNHWRQFILATGHAPNTPFQS